MARAKVRIAENYPPFGHNEIERIQKPFSVAQYEQQSWSIAIEKCPIYPLKTHFFAPIFAINHIGINEIGDKNSPLPPPFTIYSPL
jgi:hypothetical protein